MPIPSTRSALDVEGIASGRWIEGVCLIVLTNDIAVRLLNLTKSSSSSSELSSEKDGDSSSCRFRISSNL